MADLYRRAAVLALALLLLRGIAAPSVAAQTAPGTFVAPPAYSTGGLALVVFTSGTVDQLEAATVDAGAAGAWVQDSTGAFQLLIVDAPAFLRTAFNARFPSGFTSSTAVTLTRNQPAPVTPPTFSLFEASGGTPGSLVTQVDTRTGRHEGFDRFVVEFEGNTIPEYSIRYGEAPARQCASGEPVPLAGNAFLGLVMHGTYVYDPDRGVLTIPQRELTPNHPTLLEAKEACGFEAMAVWVLGTSARQPFAVQTLLNPARLVIDIAH